MNFLRKEGIYEEVTARAIKRVLARQLDTLMQDKGLTKSTLAKRMKTRRAQLDPLSEADNESVLLVTLHGQSARSSRADGVGLSSTICNRQLPYFTCCLAEPEGRPTSVFAKSSPLNSSGSPRVVANA